MLTSLGIVSANPDDIERWLLAKAENKAHENISQPAQESNGGTTPEIEGDHESLLIKVQIRAQLKAVEAEIAAVAAGLEIVHSVADKDSEGSEVEKDGEIQELEEHKVLLDSMKNKKETVIKGTGRLLDKPQKGKKKNLSLQEDDKFDAVLDVAASGLIETERDKLISKGVFTPFYQVKGFERRVQRSCLTKDDGGDLSINSVSSVSVSFVYTGNSSTFNKVP